MAALSITGAWNETTAFMAREARLVLPIGFLLLSLPGALVQATMPAMVPNELPEPGLWLLIVPVAIIAALIGNLAISHLALRGGASVGEALALGATRFWSVLVAALLLGLGATAALFLLAMFVLVASGSADPAIAVLPILLLLPALVFFWTRLILMNPAAAMERLGPIALIRRSWALTRGHFWPLLGMLLLLILAALIVAGAIQAVVGSLLILLTGPPHPDSLSFYLLLILSAAVQAVISTIFAVAVARLYAQLTPPRPSGIFS